MNSFESTEHSLNDSDWVAVRFVLGELNESETAEFERQLATSEAARDAVVRATMLVEALAAIPAPEVAPARRSPGRRIVAAITVVAAGLCVAVVGYRLLVPLSPEVVERKSSVSIDAARLAALWLDSANSLNGIPEAELAEESSADSPFALLPPDWLLAAVEQEAAMPSDGPAFDVDADSDAIERN